jgi:hypothetical protein
MTWLPSPAASSLMRVRDAAADSLRRFGPVNAFLWFASRILSVTTRGSCRLQRYYFVAQPVHFPVDSHDSKTIAIRWVAQNDEIVARFPRPPEVIARRFAMGARCLVAERHGEFVGFLWLKEHRYDEDEVRCHYRLEPRGAAVFDFDVYVEPAYRIGRTFLRLWNEANRWLGQHGYEWSISRISAFKPESLAAHRRLGTRRIGNAIFLCLGSVQVSLRSRSPYVHLGWRDRHAPCLRLSPPAAFERSTESCELRTRMNE